MNEPMHGRRSQRNLFVALVLATLVTVSGTASAADRKKKGSTWRVESSNDFIFDSDNQFSNGFSIQQFSGLFDNLDEVRGTPAFGKRLARKLLPGREGLKYREGFVLGHNIITPELIEVEEVLLDSVPYSAMLGTMMSWSAFNDKSFTGYGMLFGWMGPEALGEEIQSAVHSLIGSDDPEGWDHQLDNEPIFNFYYMKKRKIWDTGGFDGAVNADVMAGNYFTGGDVSLEMRFGHVPSGFVHIPDPFGRNLAYASQMTGPDARGFYGSLVLRASAFALSTPLEGNNFTDSNFWTENNTLDPEDFVAQAIVGIHYARPRWGIHLNWWFTTDTVDEDTLNPEDDATNDFGTLMAEWSF